MAAVWYEFSPPIVVIHFVQTSIVSGEKQSLALVLLGAIFAIQK